MVGVFVVVVHFLVEVLVIFLELSLVEQSQSLVLVSEFEYHGVWGNFEGVVTVCVQNLHPKNE